MFLGALASSSTSFAQSKGLKKIHVGVPAVSMGNMIIFFTQEAKLFEKHGLDADVVVMQGSGIASRALVAGSVEISPITTPAVMSAVLAGSDMVILAHTMPGVIQSLMVRPDIKKTEDLKVATTRSQIQRDRDLVMRYMRAHLEGIALFKKDPEFAKKVIKKTLRLDDDSLAQESWELFAKYRLPAPYPNTKGMKTSYEYVALTRPDVYKHKPEEFVDPSFVEELDKGGFIKKLYEK